MPPKKDKLSKVEFRSLVRQHGIRFKGPVPPRDWPPEYQPHFQIIRSIDTIRYDDYRTNKLIPRQRKEEFRNRVRILRAKTYDFLDDAAVNESTWRELEQLIFKRFDDRVIWYTYLICSNTRVTDYLKLVKVVSTSCGSQTMRPNHRARQ